MSREVEEVLAVWRELERIREQLPLGSTELTLVSREMLEMKRLYRSLTGQVSESHAPFDNARPLLVGAHDAVRRAKLVLEASGAETVWPEPSP